MENIYHLGYKTSIIINVNSDLNSSEFSFNIYFNHIIDIDNNQFVFIDKDNNINPFKFKHTIVKNILNVTLFKYHHTNWTNLNFISNNQYIDINLQYYLFRSKYFKFQILYWKEDISNYNIKIVGCQYKTINNNEIILETSNNKIKFIYFKKVNKIKYDELTGKIPKVIYQTWKHLDIIKHPNIQNIINTNSEYQYKLFNDEMCVDYMKNNFKGDIYNAYLQLNNPVARADFWRYCILYKEGGIYLDIDCSSIAPFKEFIFTNTIMLIPFINYNLNNTMPNFNQIIKQKLHENQVFQGFLGSVPNNPIFKKCIEMIMNNLDLYIHKNNVLELTGINLFYRAFNSYHGQLLTKYYQNELMIGSKIIQYGLYKNSNIYFNNRLVIKTQQKIPFKSNILCSGYRNDANVYQNKIIFEEGSNIEININVPNTNLLLECEKMIDYKYKSSGLISNLIYDLIYDKDKYKIVILNQINNKLVVFIKNLENKNIDMHLKINRNFNKMDKEPKNEESKEEEPKEEEPKNEESKNEEPKNEESFVTIIYFDIYEENIPKVNFTIFKSIDSYFDRRYYLTKYKDLYKFRQFHPKYAFEHWIRYGKNEKRISSKIHELLKKN